MVIAVTSSNARLVFKKETTLGVAATGNYLGLPFSSFDVVETDDNSDDPLMGYGNDPQRQTRMGVSVKGKLSGPVDTIFFGHILQGLFGPPTTTGAGPYVHTFKSGAKALPSYSFEVQHLDASPALYHGLLGLVIGALSLSFDDQGRPKYDATLTGVDGAESGTSIGGTAVFTDPVMYHQSLNLISLGGSALDKASTYNLTLDRKLEPLKYIGGGGKVGEMLLGIASYAGELTARYGDKVLSDHAKAADVLDLLVGWQIDANTYVKLDFPGSELFRKGRAIQGGGSIARTFDVKSNKPSGPTAVAVSATLGNTQATYP